MDKKQMGVGAVVAALAGGGGYASYDRLKEHAIEEGSKVWVTIAAQNQSLIFDIEDELEQIKGWIKAGTATEEDRIRKAILEERLRRLKSK